MIHPHIVRDAAPASRYTVSRTYGVPLRWRERELVCLFCDPSAVGKLEQRFREAIERPPLG